MQPGTVMQPGDDVRRSWQGGLMVLGAGVLWGTIGIFSRWLYREGLTPMQVVAGRIGLTWIVFVAAALVGERRRLAITLRDAGFFGAYGLVSVALFYGCWFYAVARLPVAVAVILLYTAPAYVAVLSVPLFGERLDRRKAMALGLTLLGAALVAGRPEPGHPLPLDGLLAGFGAGLTYGLYSLFGKAAAPRYSRGTTLVWTFSFGLLGVALAGWLGGAWPAPVPVWFSSPRAWLLLAGLALGPTVLAYYLYNGGLARIEAGRASMLATVEPVVSVLLAWLLLGEPLQGWQMLGGLLVVAAVLVLQAPGGAAPRSQVRPGEAEPAGAEPAGAHPAGARPVKQQFELAGAMHVHSTFSDGFGSVPQIIQAARAAGLDYLILTDHDTLAARQPGPGSPGQGYQDGLLFLVSSEVSPPQNHYLVLGASESPPPEWPLQRVIDAAQTAGGAGFIAHPFDKGSRVMHVDSYPWRDRDVEGYAGIEVWNFFSQLLGEVTTRPRLLAAALFPYTLVRRPQPETLRLWDEIGQRRPVAAVGGTDAHGINARLLGLPLVATNYRQMLRTVWTHVVLDERPGEDWQQNAAAVYAALGRGRSFISSPVMGEARSFRFTARGPDGPLQMGEEASLRGGTTELAVTLPGDGDIRLLRNGEPLAAERRTRGMTLTVKEPGVYRVEVYRRRFFTERLWILSNPIYLRP